MNAISRARPALVRLSVLVLLLAMVAPATARQHKPSKAPPKAKAAPATTACDQACAHVEDCPKVTCECADAAGSGVAACDTESHCCANPQTACRHFCELHKQKWTGRFTPDDGAAVPDSSGGSNDTSASMEPAATCDELCEKAEDCRAMTCQCAHGTAENVSACDAKTHCCGSARIVCEHFCSGKKGKWTGKAVESAPPADPGSSLDELYDGMEEPDGGDLH